MAKKNGVTADDILKSMYPDLKTSDDYVDPNAKTEETDSAKQISALQAQIAALTGTRDTPKAKNRELQALPQAPVRPIMDMATAPDPVQYPKDYATWVSQQTSAQIQYEKDNWAWQNSVVQTQNNRANELWDDFRSANKAYAADQEKVSIAAERVIAKNKAAGVNTEKYMFEDSARFMDDVTATYDKLFGKPKDSDGGSADDDDEDDRSTIQSAGAPAGRNGPGDVAPKPEKFGALSQDINAWQQKTGFYR